MWLQGSCVGYNLYDRYSTSVRAAHFVFLPFVPPTRADLAANNVTLSAQGEFTYELSEIYSSKGYGYFQLQSTKVRVWFIQATAVSSVSAKCHRVRVMGQSSRSTILDRREVYSLYVFLLTPLHLTSIRFKGLIQMPWPERTDHQTSIPHRS